MKCKQVYLLYTFLLITTLYASKLIHANCLAPDGKHHDKNVPRCSYTQQDIQDMAAKNPKRFAALGRKNRCIYCGCFVNKHSLKKNQ